MMAVLKVILVLCSLVTLAFAIAPVSSDVCVTSNGTAAKITLTATDPDLGETLNVKILTTNLTYGVATNNGAVISAGLVTSTVANTQGSVSVIVFYSATPPFPEHTASFTFQFFDSVDLPSAVHTARVIVSRSSVQCSVDEPPVQTQTPSISTNSTAPEAGTGCDSPSCDDCLGKRECVYCEGDDDDSKVSFGLCVGASSADVPRCLSSNGNRIREKAETCPIINAPKSSWGLLKKAFQHAVSLPNLSLRKKFLIVVSHVVKKMEKPEKNAQAVEHAISVFVELLGHEPVTEEDQDQLCKILKDALLMFDVNTPTPLACRVARPVPTSGQPPPVSSGSAAGQRKRVVSDSSYVAYLTSDAGAPLFSLVALKLAVIAALI